MFRKKGFDHTDSFEFGAMMGVKIDNAVACCGVFGVIN